MFHLSAVMTVFCIKGANCPEGKSSKMKTQNGGGESTMRANRPKGESSMGRIVQWVKSPVTLIPKGKYKTPGLLLIIIKHSPKSICLRLQFNYLLRTLNGGVFLLKMSSLILTAVTWSIVCTHAYFIHSITVREYRPRLFQLLSIFLSVHKILHRFEREFCYSVCLLNRPINECWTESTVCIGSLYKYAPLYSFVINT
jgi:hypothetical protein